MWTRRKEPKRRKLRRLEEEEKSWEREGHGLF